MSAAWTGAFEACPPAWPPEQARRPRSASTGFCAPHVKHQALEEGAEGEEATRARQNVGARPYGHCFLIKSPPPLTLFGENRQTRAVTLTDRDNPGWRRRRRRRKVYSELTQEEEEEEEGKVILNQTGK